MLTNDQLEEFCRIITSHQDDFVQSIFRNFRGYCNGTVDHSTKMMLVKNSLSAPLNRTKLIEYGLQPKIIDAIIKDLQDSGKQINKIMETEDLNFTIILNSNEARISPTQSLPPLLETGQNENDNAMEPFTIDVLPEANLLSLAIGLRDATLAERSAFMTAFKQRLAVAPMEELLESADGLTPITLLVSALQHAKTTVEPDEKPEQNNIYLRQLLELFDQSIQKINGYADINEILSTSTIERVIVSSLLEAMQVALNASEFAHVEKIAKQFNQILNTTENGMSDPDMLIRFIRVFKTLCARWNENGSQYHEAGEAAALFSKALNLIPQETLQNNLQQVFLVPPQQIHPLDIVNFMITCINNMVKPRDIDTSPDSNLLVQQMDFLNSIAVASLAIDPDSKNQLLNMASFLDWEKINQIANDTLQERYPELVRQEEFELRGSQRDPFVIPVEPASPPPTPAPIASRVQSEPLGVQHDQPPIATRSKSFP